MEMEREDERQTVIKIYYVRKEKCYFKWKKKRRTQTYNKMIKCTNEIIANQKCLCMSRETFNRINNPENSRKYL